MIIAQRNSCWFEVVYILCFLSISPHITSILSSESSLFGHELKDSVAEEKFGYDALYIRKRRDLMEERNRDGHLPRFPVEPDLRLQSSYIVNAHQVLRVGLQQFLNFKDTDLGTYLNYLINKHTEPFVDEYGQVIRVYKKVLRFIWKQHNETLVENYAVGQFDKDKLDLCSVARYLSHQQTVDLRETIMKRMGDALGYTCHPCTPYTPKQYGETIVPSMDGINPEGVSPEESLILCKEIQMEGQDGLPSLGISTTTPGIITTTLGSIKPENPSFDYTPCNHSNGDVVCDKVPLEEVQKAFRRTSFPRLVSAKLTLHPFIFIEKFIPEDVFGTKLIRDIKLEYSMGSGDDIKLQVDANAFRSTKSYTNIFTIEMIDCTLLDLGFLSGFDKLNSLEFTHIFNIHHCLPSLPSLPNLFYLRIIYCTGMNHHLNIFPTLTNGLKGFNFKGYVYNIPSIYDDETVDRVLDWILLSSANTLEDMEITYMNRLTRIPNIASFKTLKRLWLSNINLNMSIIRSGSFPFSAPVSLLHLRDNGIKEIQPGAFQGDFKDAQVYLYNNYLTRFEESVFGPMIQQMASGYGGFINGDYDAGNPIDCSDGSICHLAWLRRYQAAVKLDLKCSNGTSFKDLQPAGFNHCQIEYNETAVSNRDDSNSPIKHSSFDYKPCSISNEDVVCDIF